MVRRCGYPERTDQDHEQHDVGTDTANQRSCTTKPGQTVTAGIHGFYLRVWSTGTGRGFVNDHQRREQPRQTQQEQQQQMDELRFQTAIGVCLGRVQS